MTDLTPTEISERPLVTFALFAYNQEQYIREAVEGAFAQTYEPLEIILSDDCSSDRTFEIMQEMAAAYEGPHEVRVRKNEVNFGTALHVQAVAKHSKGTIVVVAAGDDVSLPERCERIAYSWTSSAHVVSCIHSGAISFENCELSEEIRLPRTTSIISIKDRMNFLLEDRLPFLSPTCAYSRKLFDDFEPLMGGSIIEDGILAMRSLSVGAVLSIDEPLVRLRVQERSSGRGSVISEPDRWNRFMRSRIISYCNKIRDLSHAEIDKNSASMLDKMYRKKIRRLASFIISPMMSASNFMRVLFLARYALFYPSSASVMKRIADAFLVTGGYPSSRGFTLIKSTAKKLAR
jgi:glycosyltransferase involved in cell wall biosynthesis